MRQCPPTRSNQRAPPLQHPSHRWRQLLVDCFFFSSNRGHLRSRSRPSLFFLMGLFLASQTREPMVERASPTPRACRWPIGIGRTKCWVHGRCCHGDRAKLVEGRVAAGLRCVFCVWLCFAVCVLWLCFGVKRLLATVLVKSWVWASQNGQNVQFFRTHNRNALLDAPNVNGCAKSASSLDFAHVLTFWLKCDVESLWMQKSVLFFT